MPRNLEKITLKELEQKFDDNDDFIIEDVEGTSDGVMMTYRTRKSICLYDIQFYVSPYAKLGQPAKIYDITAAIDESKFFGLKISFG